MEAPPKKSRGPKVSSEQISTMMDFMALPANRVILTLKPHPSRTLEISKLWESASKIINTVKGPKKTGEDWRRFFVEYKARVKKKARDFSIALHATGGGENKAKPLTEDEQKLVGLIGWVSVDGCKGLPEEIDPEEVEREVEAVMEQQPAEDVAQTQPSTTQERQHVTRYAISSESEEEAVHHTAEEAPVEISLPAPRSASLRKKTRPAAKKTIKKNYTSSVSLLHESAKIYSEGASEISKAMTHVGDSITHFGNSLQLMANALVGYTEMMMQQLNVQIVEEHDDQEILEAED